jgi:hypothetical protein
MCVGLSYGGDVVVLLAGSVAVLSSLTAGDYRDGQSKTLVAGVRRFVRLGACCC